jgi:hypothetical protein
MYARFNPKSFRMDLRKAPWLKAYIARDPNQNRWLMMLLLHHMAGDQATMEVIQDEITAHLLQQADRLPKPMPFRNLVAQARGGE